jgi:hypothetical protein
MTAIHINSKCKKIHLSRLTIGWKLLFESIAMNLFPKDEISHCLYQHIIIIYFQVIRQHYFGKKFNDKITFQNHEYQNKSSACIYNCHSSTSEHVPA